MPKPLMHFVYRKRVMLVRRGTSPLNGASPVSDNSSIQVESSSIIESKRSTARKQKWRLRFNGRSIRPFLGSRRERTINGSKRKEERVMRRRY
ncbi:ATP-dependent RNA helicase DBP2 [Fusarium oxysporum f. sp. albedinis]|nr:ATP-dependent RNA helicase DBP2 [Fusarium oxysporum f. sp. albedinis]